MFYLCVAVINDFLSVLFRRRQVRLSPQQGNTSASHDGYLRLYCSALYSPLLNPMGVAAPPGNSPQPANNNCFRPAGCGVVKLGRQRDGSVNKFQQLRQHAPTDRAVVSKLRAVRCTASLVARRPSQTPIGHCTTRLIHYARL